MYDALLKFSQRSDVTICRALGCPDSYLDASCFGSIALLNKASIGEIWAGTADQETEPENETQPEVAEHEGSPLNREQSSVPESSTEDAGERGE